MEQFEIFEKVLTILFAAGASFGAIRADLRSAIKNSEEAITKIDNHITDHAKGSYK